MKKIKELFIILYISLSLLFKRIAVTPMKVTLSDISAYIFNVDVAESEKYFNSLLERNYDLKDGNDD